LAGRIVETTDVRNDRLPGFMEIGLFRAQEATDGYFGHHSLGNQREELEDSNREISHKVSITAVKEVYPSNSKDAKLDGKSMQVEGYTFSGGRKIISVDVSADDGPTWHQAELLENETMGYKSWAWTRWKWTVPRAVAEAGGGLVVKAVDEVHNTQPERYEPQWDFGGDLTGGWHRVECPKRRKEREESEMRAKIDLEAVSGRR
jgi:hypothetical protein